MNTTDTLPPNRPETEHPHPTTFTNYAPTATNSDMPWEPPAKKRRGKKRGRNPGAFGKGGRK